MSTLMYLHITDRLYTSNNESQLFVHLFLVVDQSLYQKIQQQSQQGEDIPKI